MIGGVETLVALVTSKARVAETAARRLFTVLSDCSTLMAVTC